jgi:hypothetical protein
MAAKAEKAKSIIADILAIQKCNISESNSVRNLVIGDLPNITAFATRMARLNKPEIIKIAETFKIPHKPASTKQVLARDNAAFLSALVKAADAAEPKAKAVKPKAKAVKPEVKAEPEADEDDEADEDEADEDDEVDEDDEADEADEADEDDEAVKGLKAALAQAIKDSEVAAKNLATIEKARAALKK